MMAPGYELAGGPKVALASWFATLASLGEARRRDHKLAGTIGAAVLGAAGLEAALMPKTTLSIYGMTEGVTEMSAALLCACSCFVLCWRDGLACPLMVRHPSASCGET